MPCVHGREVFCYSGVSYELENLQIWLHLVELVEYEKKGYFFSDNVTVCSKNSEILDFFCEGLIAEMSHFGSD